MLRIRAVLIRIDTDKGLFGVRHQFEGGLNILRAENSAGKSTILQAIIYALGLEGMNSPSQDMPLPHAVYAYLDAEGSRFNVVESAVLVEMWNEPGAITVERQIKGARDRRLITVHEGPILSNPAAAVQTNDYFVRVGGAAQSERGFHHRLALFLGWTLPTAPRYDAEDRPLYLETLFPLFFVEQKLGWGRLPARFPTWLGIKDIRRRTVEFVLGMDAYQIAVERTAVQQEIVRIRASWSAARTALGKLSLANGAELFGMPQEPSTVWPPEYPPALWISERGVYKALREYLPQLQQRLEALLAKHVPESGEDNTELKAELALVEDELSATELEIRSIIDQIETGLNETEALEERIQGIVEDVRKYKDIQRLRKYGSSNQEIALEEQCPVCHQEIADSLLNMRKGTPVMSAEQNISFYEDQLRLFRSVLEAGRTESLTKQARLTSRRADADSLRARVRSIRETLTSPEHLPSIDAVTTRLRLEQRIASLKYLQTQFADGMAELAGLADEWKAVQQRLAALPKGSLSKRDEEILAEMQGLFRLQLQQYDFKSVDVSEINISRDDYSPELDGLNLKDDAAASDVIRLQWAYLLALLQIGARPGGHHPGLLIFDEPQQQSTDDRAFLRMLAYAASLSGLQVIVATSHDRNNIRLSLGSSKSTTIWELQDARILQRL